ncbi:hypothetical protein Rruber_03726 [Rhodococcus ruber]
MGALHTSKPTFSRCRNRIPRLITASNDTVLVGVTRCTFEEAWAKGITALQAALLVAHVRYSSTGFSAESILLPS